MIYIGFVNLILIIADNTSGFGEPGNPYLSALGAPGSPRPSAPVVSEGVKPGTVTSDAGKKLTRSLTLAL